MLTIQARERLIDGAKSPGKVKGAGARTQVKRLALNRAVRLVKAGGSCTSIPNITLFSVKLKTKGICCESEFRKVWNGFYRALKMNTVY